MIKCARKQDEKSQRKELVCIFPCCRAQKFGIPKADSVPRLSKHAKNTTSVGSDKNHLSPVMGHESARLPFESRTDGKDAASSCRQEESRVNHGKKEQRMTRKNEPVAFATRRGKIFEKRARARACLAQGCVRA